MTKTRLGLATGKALATLSETQAGSEVHFQRVIAEMSSMRALASPPAELINAYLKNDANSPSMAINGATEAFRYVVPDGKVAAIESLVWTLADDNLSALHAAFGGLGGPLANGILLGVYASAVQVLELLPRTAIKRTTDLISILDAPLVVTGSGGLVMGRARLAHGLLLTAGQSIVATINDDLSTLQRLDVQVLGVLRSADVA